MSYDPYTNYWKDFYFRRIEWFQDVLKEHPDNLRALQEIKESKEMLYKKFLIIVDDEPVKKQAPEQLTLF